MQALVVAHHPQAKVVETADHGQDNNQAEKKYFYVEGGEISREGTVEPGTLFFSRGHGFPGAQKVQAGRLYFKPSILASVESTKLRIANNT